MSLMTVKRMLGLAVLAMGVLLIPVGASAQAPGKFLISAGGGYGSADAACDDCSGDRQNGGAGYFRLGYTVAPKLVLGFETNVWTKQEAVETGVSATMSFYNVSGTLAFYPKETGFFVRGGAGAALANIDIEIEDANVNAELGSGFGVLGGVGYDIRVSRRLSITPGVNVWYGKLGDLKALGETFATGWSHNVVDFTIGLTFR
jgi:hypothetical protein